MNAIDLDDLHTAAYAHRVRSAMVRRGMSLSLRDADRAVDRYHRMAARAAAAAGRPDVAKRLRRNAPVEYRALGTPSVAGGVRLSFFGRDQFTDVRRSVCSLLVGAAWHLLVLGLRLARVDCERVVVFRIASDPGADGVEAFLSLHALARRLTENRGLSRRDQRRSGPFSRRTRCVLERDCCELSIEIDFHPASGIAMCGWYVCRPDECAATISARVRALADGFGSRVAVLGDLPLTERVVAAGGLPRWAHPETDPVFDGCGAPLREETGHPLYTDEMIVRSLVARHTTPPGKDRCFRRWGAGHTRTCDDLDAIHRAIANDEGVSRADRRLAECLPRSGRADAATVADWAARTIVESATSEIEHAGVRSAERRAATNDDVAAHGLHADAVAQSQVAMPGGVLTRPWEMTIVPAQELLRQAAMVYRSAVRDEWLHETRDADVHHDLVAAQALWSAAAAPSPTVIAEVVPYLRHGVAAARDHVYEQLLAALQWDVRARGVLVLTVREAYRDADPSALSGLPGDTDMARAIQAADRAAGWHTPLTDAIDAAAVVDEGIESLEGRLSDRAA